MLLKLKNWFSIDNNVNLVRDLLFIFSLLFAMILGLSSCTPVAHAMEVETESTEATEVEVKEETLCFNLPSYSIDDTIYSYPSLQIPYKYTDKIYAYHYGEYNPLTVIAINFVDASDDAYVAVYDSGKGGHFEVHGASTIEYIHYVFDEDLKEFTVVAEGPADNTGSPDGSISLPNFRYEFSTFDIVYSTADIIDVSDGSVYYRSFGSFASFMESLGSFGGFILSMWESVADFVTDNPYILLSLLAWLLVMAAGVLLKMFKA